MSDRTSKTNRMKPLTQAEIDSGIAYKTLLIARHGDGSIVRVTSPSSLAPWTHDGSTWTIDADQEPAADNTNGIYVCYSKAEVRKYHGTLCKVVLSGTIVEGETGARGQKARLLEVDGLDEAAFKFIGHYPLFGSDRKIDLGSGASS